MNNMMEINKALESYSIDIEFALNVSPFEFKETLSLRDSLEEIKDELSSSQKEELKKCDKMLISKAAELYQHLKPIKIWGNNVSLEKWWWHLDMITNREIKVDINDNSY